MLRILMFIILFMGQVSAWAQDHGGDHPFPLSSQIDFPWQKSVGYWRAKDKDNYEYIFKFTIKKLANNKKQLLIEQYDPKSCELVARGPGRQKISTVKDSGKTKRDVTYVQALMTGLNLAEEFQYLAVIRAYIEEKKESKSSRNIPPNVQDAQLMMSILPAVDSPAQFIHMKLEKIDNRNSLSCMQNIRSH